MKGKNENGLAIPEADKHFIISNRTRDALEITERLSKKHPVNILLTGPQGSGKSSLAKQFASRFERPFLSVECGFLQEPQQWFGRLDLQKNRTVYLESSFIQAVQTRRACIMLDELNRVENEKVLNVLMSFLDERRRAFVDDLQKLVQVAKEVVFFATLNEGRGFAGIDRVDVALRSRFREIPLDYLPQEIEIEVLRKKTKIKKEIAEILSKFAWSMRNDGTRISTRLLLMAGEDIALGASLKDAVLRAAGFSQDSKYQEKVLQHLHFFLTPEQCEQEEEISYAAF